MSKTTVRGKSAARKNNSSYWIIGGVAAGAVIVLILVFINLNAPRAIPIEPQVSAGRTWGQAEMRA